jgi:DNA-binding transcriptional MocR family regulator
VRAELKERLKIVNEFFESTPYLRHVPPRGGVVCFPEIVGADVERAYAAFVRRGVMVAQGGWFERPRAHFRLGFGWPPLPQLREGLRQLAEALEEAAH